MINFVLIEDVQDHCILLKRLIKESLPDLNYLGEAPDVQSGIELIRKTSPDLVFLDIELPDGNAFKILDKLMPVKFEIIFTTAHNQYALKAIHYSALDYLLKPVDVDELQHAIQKVVKRIDQKNLNLQLSNLLFNVRKPEDVQRLALPVKDGFDFVDIKDVIRCESANNCTVVYTKGGKKYVSSKSTKEFELILPEAKFFRIHHSEIVNIDFVKKYYKEGRGGYIELTDGTSVPVAYRRKDDFLSRFGFSS